MLEYAQIFPYCMDMRLIAQIGQIDIWMHEQL